MLRFRPYTIDDYPDVMSLELRALDTKENFLTTHSIDQQVIHDSLYATDVEGGEVYVIEQDREIKGICGIINQDTDGIVWMLTSKEFPEDAIKFYRESKRLIERWSKEYLLMFNYILTERTEDFRFLEMLGFHIDTFKTLQIEDAEVYRFYMQGR